ncbi:MAG TPA: DUF6801 domain-containing protein [Pseudonocardiaceae bacterium]|jgi:hypothetical protein|nr:DUF6801 domain-containing protein [Pseudonocardiaceae bacterium]
MWRRTTTRRSTKRVLVGSGIGVALALLGLLAGAGPAIGDQTTATTLAYTCQFPAGPQQVSAQFDATFPRTGQAGQPIAATNVSVKLDVPQAALGDLTTIGAASVSTTGAFSVVRQSNADVSTLTWPDLAAPSASLPSTGDLSLALAGPVPPTTVSQSGDVTFSADAFGLIFTPLTSAGAATNPATMSIACLLNANQTATLATVHLPAVPVVGRAGGSTSGVPVPPVGRRQAGNAAASTTTTTTPPPVNDPNCTPFKGPTIHPTLVGRANLNNLNESSAVGPGIATLTLVGSKLKPAFTVCYSGTLVMPPSTSSELGFGFMPITTTLTYTQVGPLFVEAYSIGANSFATATSMENIAITSASINGVPLNVGPKCGTSQPVPITLSSIPGFPYNPITGGYLQGPVNIPTMSDCGVGENLNALLSAPVTGPNNLLRMCQENSVTGQKPFVNCVAP